MTYETLISVGALEPHLEDEDWVIIDCRSSLEDRTYGQQAYQRAHIPGAIFADLESALSGAITPGITGRHPLPPVPEMVERLSQWGVDTHCQVIAYDDFNGAYAARLWWILRWLGHRAVAVLDGGWTAWLAAGLPTSSDPSVRSPRKFHAVVRKDLLVDAEKVLGILLDPRFQLVDSRGQDRYRGDEEPIDVVAGHIPGAINLPYADNLGEGGFLSREDLRSRFEPLLQDHKPEELVFYCGSGVTAAHNLLALQHAGLGEAKMYPGSWSEWIIDPSRPIAKGEQIK